MAVVITASEVREEYPELVGSSSDTKISGLIALTNGADLCLDNNSVADDIQRCIKLEGVAYMLEVSIDGNLSSSTSANGDSISLDKSGKRGIDQFNHGRLLQMLDTHQCLIRVIGDQGSTPVFFGVAKSTYAERFTSSEQSSRPFSS